MFSVHQHRLGVILRHLSASSVKWVTTTSQGSQHLASQPGTGETKMSDLLSTEDLKQRLRIQFSRAKLGLFTQTPPHQENIFANNAFLTSYLTQIFPKEVHNAVWADLIRFGHRAVTDIYPLGRECELSQPYVRAFDAWGNRTDDLVTCQAWKDLKKISAEEGLIASAYEGKYGEYDRLYQMVKLYIFSPVSGLYSCPLAMTDGAAKTAKMITSDHLQEAYQHLTSRDPQKFWTSGQWMTEKRGGSDVSGSTETVALEQPDGTYQLFGYKWFSSATDADMALTLANIISEDQPEPKPRGLTMFYLETRREDGKLNGIEIVKLKNKLGTRQVPPPGVSLDGSVATPGFPAGARGYCTIANMLTINGEHNSISSCALMGRLLGREEAGVATHEESLVLRIITPIMKFFTAKMAMTITSEGLECFGGQGYIEDTGLPAHLRDAQVLPIWEGTTNIMSLDFLRAVTKSEGEALTVLFGDVKARLQHVMSSTASESLGDSCQKVNLAMDELISFMQKHPHLIFPGARDIATTIAHIYIGSLLLEHAAWEETSISKEVASRWCQQPLTCLTPEQYHADNKALIMEGYNASEVYGPMF
nr:acyl-CoA dehydrogenase family member 11-like [Cherax quadricarinatus]